MNTTKVFKSGNSFAVRIPKDFCSLKEEVIVQHLNDTLIITKKEKAWDTLMKGINGFSDDFMANGGEEEVPSLRKKL